MAFRLAAPLALGVVAATADAAGEVMIDFPDAQVEDRTVAYACGPTRLDVRYVNAGDVSLAIFDWNGARVVASAVVSGSGARYAGGQYVWWSKGTDATLRRHGG